MLLNLTVWTPYFHVDEVVEKPGKSASVELE